MDGMSVDDLMTLGREDVARLRGPKGTIELCLPDRVLQRLRDVSGRQGKSVSRYILEQLKKDPALGVTDLDLVNARKLSPGSRARDR